MFQPKKNCEEKQGQNIKLQMFKQEIHKKERGIPLLILTLILSRLSYDLRYSAEQEN